MVGRRRGRGHGHLFRNRVDAGRQLGRRLGAWRDTDALVLALPRGGVPVAAEVARALNAELDVLIARKVGAPSQPELAIGAVTADGGLFLDDETIRHLRITPEQLDRLVAAERDVARERERRFRAGRLPSPVIDRPVIVVDDGLATGATMSAAVHALRKQGPARTVVGVPVGSRFACELLGAEADEVICLHTPEPFRSVGLFYREFLQTDDTEVEAILDEFRVQDRKVETSDP